jgi:hypothetical protein
MDVMARATISRRMLRIRQTRLEIHISNKKKRKNECLAEFVEAFDSLT